LSWLLARQNADGGIDGPPDQPGPRPFPFYMPILTDAPVPLAFGHVRSQVQGAASPLIACAYRRVMAWMVRVLCTEVMPI